MRNLVARACCLLLSAGITSVHAAAPFTTVILTGERVYNVPPSPPAPAVNFGGVGTAGVHPLLSDPGEIAFLCTLSGDSVTFLNNDAVISGVAGNMLVHGWERAVAPTPSPTRLFRVLQPPALNDDGSLAFFSSLSFTNGLQAGSGFFVGDFPALTISAFDTAPGTGVQFEAFSYPSHLSGVGIAFGAKLCQTGACVPGVTNADNMGIWVGFVGSTFLLAREGDPAPGTAPGVTYLKLNPTNLNESTPDRPRVNESGTVVFGGTITGPGVVPGVNDECIWIGTPGAVTLVLRTGDPVPGLPGGVVFQDFIGEPDLNDAGQVAFRAKVSGAGITFLNDFGIWAGLPGSLGLVAQSGDPAPGVPGEVFDIGGLGPPLINGSGTIAFSGNVTPFGDGGIWSGPPGGLALVALYGGPAPSLPGFTLEITTGEPFALSPTGQVAFQADAIDTVSRIGGVWATDASGVLTSVFHDGETIEVRPGDFRTLISGGSGLQGSSGITTGSGGENGLGRSFNAAGDLVLNVAFDDASFTQGILLAHLGPMAVSAIGPGSTGSPGRLTVAPNPFSTSTRLSFDLARDAGPANLRILDVRGRAVRSFRWESGVTRRDVAWDGRDEDGRRVAAGVYFVRLETTAGKETRRVALVR